MKDGKYEEALERARAGKPIDEVFPELKESEDERIRKMLISLVKHHADTLERQYEEDMLVYLERQKEPLTPEEKMNHPLYLEGFDVGKKVGEVLKEQKPAEWSDEDDAKWYGVIETEEYMLRVVRGEQRFDVGNKEIERQCEEELDWLKSLRPQKHWKPSEEQMRELRNVISGCSHETSILVSLENDLKKLM